MSLFSRVLIPLDGSPGADRALEVALRLAAAGPRSLRIVSVVPVAPAFAAHPAEAAPLLAALRIDAQAALGRARERVGRTGLDVETQRLEGYPVEEIRAEIDRHRTDLLVVGHRGLSAPRMHLLGSVSYNLALVAPCPIVVAHEDRPLRSLLVAVDGSAASVSAATWAAGLAREHRARLTLLYVVPQGLEEVKFTVSRGVAHPFLGPLARRLAGESVPVDTEVHYGNVAETILRTAKKGDHDLIVLGRVGQGGPAAYLLGGVSDKVLHRATVSTAIVP